MTEVLQVSRVEWAGPQDYYDSCPDSTSDSTSFMPDITLSVSVHVIGSVRHYFVTPNSVLIGSDLYIIIIPKPHISGSRLSCWLLEQQMKGKIL